MFSLSKGLAITIVAAALGLVFSMLARPASATPGFVDLVGIDTDITGNAPTAIGSVDGCRDGLVGGDTFEVDVFVSNPDPADFINGTAYNVVYNTSVLNLIDRGDSSSLLFFQADPSGEVWNYGDPVPDTDGDFRYEVVELGGTAEVGGGIIGRFTFRVIAPGVSSLQIVEKFLREEVPNLIKDDGDRIIPLRVDGAEIRADGSQCPVATPSPTPGLLPSPRVQPTILPPAPTLVQTPTPTALPMPAITFGPGDFSCTNDCGAPLSQSASGGEPLALSASSGPTPAALPQAGREQAEDPDGHWVMLAVGAVALSGATIIAMRRRSA